MRSLNKNQHNKEKKLKNYYNRSKRINKENIKKENIKKLRKNVYKNNEVLGGGIFSRNNKNITITPKKNLTTYFGYILKELGISIHSTPIKDVPIIDGTACDNIFINKDEKTKELIKKHFMNYEALLLQSAYMTRLSYEPADIFLKMVRYLDLSPDEFNTRLELVRKYNASIFPSVAYQKIKNFFSSNKEQKDGDYDDGDDANSSQEGGDYEGDVAGSNQEGGIPNGLRKYINFYDQHPADVLKKPLSEGELKKEVNTDIEEITKIGKECENLLKEANEILTTIKQTRDEKNTQGYNTQHTDSIIKKINDNITNISNNNKN